MANPIFLACPFFRGKITVGILTCRSDPAWMVPNTLDIEYYVVQSAKDSIRLYLESGQICNFHWDKLSHTWYGDFEKGDTLRCSFGFTPLTVGTMGVLFFTDYGQKWGRGLGFGFTLDETGKVVPGELGHGEKKLGLFGPNPSIIGDTLFYLGKCHQTVSQRRGGREFCIQATATPSFRPDQYSELQYTIIPTTDQDLGVYYIISYHDLFEVILEDSTDWLQPVQAGDTLTVRVLAKPVRPGIGEISLIVVGFAPPKGPRRPGVVGIGGRLQGDLTVAFAVDESLGQIAYSSNADLPRRRPTSVIYDAYRLSSIEALPVITTRLYLPSEHWETRKKELDREFRELMK